MGSPWYKIMLGMSYYIYAGGLGALKALPGSVSKRVTPVAVIVLAKDPVVCGGHGRILCCAQRDEAQLVTDSLVVASMVGGSGHGAGASCAGQMDHMDSHDGDFTH